MPNLSDVTSEYEENLLYAQNFWAPYVETSRIYTNAAAGKTWSEDERRELIKEGREPLELNIMRRPLQFYSGYLRDNLNSPIVVGVEHSDDETADQLSTVQMDIWDRAKGYTTFLDYSDEAAKSGMSLCGIEMDYSDDFVSGDISFYGRTSNSFYLDPVFERLDLKDCGFAITRDLISRNTTSRLLQYIGEDLNPEIPIGFRDNKFINFHPQFSNFSQNRDIVAYDQYYKRTTRTRKYIIDKDSGYSRDITDLSEEELTDLHKALRRIDFMRSEQEFNPDNGEELPELEIKDIERPYVELNVFLNGLHFYSGDDKTGIVESYPFVPILCYFEPSIWNPAERVQGFPATMYSMQRQFNKRHMKIVDMMDSEISTGFKYIIGSVPDVSDLLQSGQSKLIGIDPDAPLGLDSVQELKGGGANPVLIEYQRILDELSLTLSNVNETILGIDQDSKTIISGRLAQVRIAQGLRTNRKYFDNIEQSQMLLSRLVLIAIQKNYPARKVQRILGEEPTQQFFDEEFEKYDVVLKQGLRSQTQRDSYYNEIVGLKREQIVDVPDKEIVRALGITGLSDLEKAMQEQQEAQQEQQKKIDLQELVAIELENSKKEENLGLAQERRSRVRSNIALEEERVSEAEENRAQAALARAKTITEIAGMQEERMLKVLKFVDELNRQETEDRELVSAKVEKESKDIILDTEVRQDAVIAEVVNEQEPEQPEGG